MIDYEYPEIYWYNHRQCLRVNVTPPPDAGPPPKVGETVLIRYGNLIDAGEGAAIPVWEPALGQDEWVVERIEKVGDTFTVDLITYDESAGFGNDDHLQMEYENWPAIMCVN